jgi:hypothetical protein
LPSYASKINTSEGHPSESPINLPTSPSRSPNWKPSASEGQPIVPHLRAQSSSDAPPSGRSTSKHLGKSLPKGPNYSDIDPRFAPYPVLPEGPPPFQTYDANTESSGIRPPVHFPGIPDSGNETIDFQGVQMEVPRSTVDLMPMSKPTVDLDEQLKRFESLFPDLKESYSGNAKTIASGAPSLFTPAMSQDTRLVSSAVSPPTTVSSRSLDKPTANTNPNHIPPSIGGGKQPYLGYRVAIPTTYGQPPHRAGSISSIPPYSPGNLSQVVPNVQYAVLPSAPQMPLTSRPLPPTPNLPLLLPTNAAPQKPPLPPPQRKPDVQRVLGRLENTAPLRTMFIPEDLLSKFEVVAQPNTNRNLETCGILCGSLFRGEVRCFFFCKIHLGNSTVRTRLNHLLSEYHYVVAVHDPFANSKAIEHFGYLRHHARRRDLCLSR